MKTEEEIREKINELKQEIKECEDINSYYAGYLGGSMSILQEWVLEDTECTEQ